MTGHVFHEGHQALHGITVVLRTKGAHTYVGRFDTQDANGVHLLDVAIHDASDAAISKEEFLRRTLKFGVRSEQKHVLIPSDEVAGVIPLNAVEG